MVEWDEIEKSSFSLIVLGSEDFIGLITWIDASHDMQTDDQGLGVSQWATSGYISF